MSVSPPRLLASWLPVKARIQHLLHCMTILSVKARRQSVQLTALLNGVIYLSSPSTLLSSSSSLLPSSSSSSSSSEQISSSPFSFHSPAVGELRTQKLKSHLVRRQSLNLLRVKPGVGRYIAINATLTAGDFFLAYFYTSGPSPAFFPKPLTISSVLAVAYEWFLCRPAE